MGKGAKKDRKRARAGASPEPSVAVASAPDAPGRSGSTDRPTGRPKVPTHLWVYAHAAPLTGAKKIKKKCCRSTPRCKGCPVVLMRAARLHEAGVTGKDLKKAMKKARAA